MGFFRGSFLYLFCVLLFSSLLAMNLFLTLNLSLSYDNVQKELPGLASELAHPLGGVFEQIKLGEGPEGIDLNKAASMVQDKLKRYCTNSSAGDYTFSFEGQAITLPCSASEGNPEQLYNATLNGFVDNVYYKEYDCNFWNCFSTGDLPLFLVSQKAKDYWHQKFYFALIASLIFMALLLLIVERKTNWPILIGAFLIIAAAPLLKINYLIGLFIPDSLKILSVFLAILFSKAYTVFWISFIVGLVLIGLGIGLKVSNAEFVKKISERMDKKANEKKELEKKDMGKKAVKKKGKN